MPFSRRAALAAICMAAAVPFAVQAASAQDASSMTRDAILNDPAAPVGGNPKGDVTIVAYLDYNCPYCKTSAAELARVVKEDGKVRLVYKDWPILGSASIVGAQLAIAAKYQGKYEAAHNALMAIPGRRVGTEQMREALAGAGIDMARLDADAKVNGDEIDALVKRTMVQADAMGFQGTPTYLVGPFMTTTLDYDGFKQAISDARKRQAKK